MDQGTFRLVHGLPRISLETVNDFGEANYMLALSQQIKQISVLVHISLVCFLLFLFITLGQLWYYSTALGDLENQILAYTQLLNFMAFFNLMCI